MASLLFLPATVGEICLCSASPHHTDQLSGSLAVFPSQTLPVARQRCFYKQVPLPVCVFMSGYE